jgi:hypothetical protein
MSLFDILMITSPFPEVTIAVIWLRLIVVCPIVTKFMAFPVRVIRIEESILGNFGGHVGPDYAIDHVNEAVVGRHVFVDDVDGVIDVCMTTNIGHP